MKSAGWAATVAVGLVAGHARGAHADEPRATPAAIEVDREVAPAGQVEHGFDSGEPVAGWAASVAVGLLSRPLVLRTDADHVPVGRRETLVLGGALAMTPGIVLDIRWPLVRQTGSRLQGLGDDRALARDVLGDLRLGARIAAAGGPHGGAWVRAELGLPTGNAAQFAGESSWTFGASLIGRLALPAAIAAVATVGVRLRRDEVAIGPTVAGDEAFGAVGASVPVGTHLALTGELTGILGDTIARQTGPSPVEVRGGVVARPLHGFAAGIRAGAGVNDEIGSPAWRITFTLTYQGDATLFPRVAPADDAP